MKLSLRTVTTQLLNVTNPDEESRSPTDLKNETSKKGEMHKLVTIGKIEKVDKSEENNKDELIKEEENILIKHINAEISSLEAAGVGFGRPTNSKFGYFESSHPGEAMAMTDEELEKELASKKHPVPFKNKPTTSGGISTWILLNSPTTTPKSFVQSEPKRPEAATKFTVKPTATIEKIVHAQATVPKIAPVRPKANVTSANNNQPKITTVKPAKVQVSVSKVSAWPAVKPGPDPTTPKSATTSSVKDNDVTLTEKPVVPPKRIAQNPRTPKPKPATSTVRTVTKNPRPNLNRGKIPARTTTTTTTTPKPENTGENVTFKPVHVITTMKNEVRTEKPVLITRIKTSVSTNVRKNDTSASLVKLTTPRTTEASTTSRTDFTGSDLVEAPANKKPTTSKLGESVEISVQKPIEEITDIEIEPIKVNAPVLKIEKVTDDTTESIAIATASISDISSPNRDVAPINAMLASESDSSKDKVETSSEEPTVTTTTKKPRRNSQKRKKNKTKRRRRPSTTTAASNEIASSEVSVTDATVQESKVEPETKLVNSTKNKKQAGNKQAVKPIGTQIYNYLSREIMPSFGVVSLVGLGLGLASYFLYPFGGGIARRNYEVEPNYKYDLGEYGGNYGQNEEEVFSKVIQGMTNHESKYGQPSDYNRNQYYRYQTFGSPSMTETKLTKKTDHRYPSTSSRPTYKPLENTYDLKYRNTEFKYPEVTTTANYFERQQQSGYTVASDDDVNRQFVVGNVPKEYSYDENPVVGQKDSAYAANHAVDSQFDRNVVPNYFRDESTNAGSPTYGQPEAQALKSGDKYEEVEITPTAVAVEHGPRALKVKRSVDDHSLHRIVRRESVIQIIPPKDSANVEEEEEDLSNEIFDILDSMIPGKEHARKVKDAKTSNDLENDLKSAKHAKQNVQSESTESSAITDVKSTEAIAEKSSAMPSSSTTETAIGTGSSISETAATLASAEESSDGNSTENEVKDAEDTTLDSSDSTTENPVKEEEPAFNIFNFVRKVAEIKFRLGLTILKHASEGFARYLGGVQKRLNGEE